MILKRVCELGFAPFQPAEHQMNHADVDHSFAGSRVAFVVLAMSTIPPQPAEGSLDDPAFRKHNEAFELGRSKYCLEQPAERGAHTQRQVVATVGDVRKDHLHAAKLRSQSVEHAEHVESPVVVLDSRRVYDHGENQSQGVDHQVPFAAVDLLASVEAPSP